MLINKNNRYMYMNLYQKINWKIEKTNCYDYENIPESIKIEILKLTYKWLRYMHIIYFFNSKS